jgi:hypothetical protein
VTYELSCLLLQDPQPHVSVAWSSGDAHQQLNSAVQQQWGDMGPAPLRMLVSRRDKTRGGGRG